MKSPKLVLAALFVLIPLVSWSQTVVSPLSSPVFAAGGAGTASLESPFSDRFNPAASAWKQRVTLDASYFGLPGFDTGATGYGNAFNLGLTLPSRWGVFTGSGSYVGANFPGLNTGNLGEVTFGASKDVFDDLSLGASVDLSLANGDWGAGLTLGFLHRIGDLGFLKDFNWGMALRDMGKGAVGPSTPSATSGAAVPPPFTPALGAEFSVFKSGGLDVVLRPDVSLPSFQDLNLSLGTTLSLQDFFYINAAYAFDWRDTQAGTGPKIPVSIGVGFKFTTDIKNKIDLLNFTEQGWNQSEVNVNTAAIPLSGGVYGFGGGINIPLGVKDTKPPKVDVAAQTTYISPNNDGVQDELDLPVKITDERFVQGYTLTVKDSSGTVVRAIQNKVIVPETQGLDNLWKRITYEKKGVNVPPQLVWNGFTEAGTVAPDGTYSLEITAWDDNGNKGTTNAGSVVVKNAPPQASANATFTEFNPTGPRDQLPLVQTGSVEGQWTGTIKNARGDTVRTQNWQNSSPQNFSWDGKTNVGDIVPDGVYSYELTAVDKAGNRTTVKVGNLLVNSLPTPLDVNLNRNAFSPAGNGVKTLVFQPKPGLTAGITGWSLAVLDKDGNAKRLLKGQGAVPAQVEFDGKDNSNQPLPEGDYKAKLVLEYSNGNKPEALSSAFSLINTPPQAKVTVPYTVFSPGAEEGRSVISFQQQTSQEDFWTGQIVDSQSKVIRTIRWPSKADATYLWDGRGSDGQFLPDGNYSYSLEAQDRAGNTGRSTPQVVTIDTQKRSVLLSSDRSAFSPGTTSAFTKVKFLPQFKVAEGLDTWNLQIEDATGSPVKTWVDQAKILPFVEWDGKDNQGKIAPDGTYTAVLKTVYQNGSAPSARSNAVLIKTQLPTIDLKADALIFSPTPDSKRPAVVISQNSSSESEWQGKILKGDQVVKSWSWKGKAPDVTWDGTDETGNKSADGTYAYQVQAVDEAGNKVSKNLTGIVLDSRPTPVFVTVGSDGFSPNGDGQFDTQIFTTRVSLNEGIASWKLEMVHSANGVKKTFQGTGPVPAQVTWDGINDLNSKAEDGVYTAKLSVLYTKGNAPSTQSTPFYLQGTPPQTSLVLDPQPFSPDNDGVADELNIALGVKSFAPISDWNVEITDPEGHHFTSFSGKGSPSAKLTWDGRSDTGELVQSASDYSLTFQVKDVVGNAASLKKTISVDVLVIRDGDKLRIIIPSITFLANKADFLNVEPDKAAKNVSVLKRLAEIFTKYARYKITIEGHAVMVNWQDPAAGKKEQDNELVPLSKDRAEAVKKFLISLGIQDARITTVGVGGGRPIVPFGDLDNRWKDRRVEFLLNKE